MGSGYAFENHFAEVVRSQLRSPAIMGKRHNPPPPPIRVPYPKGLNGWFTACKVPILSPVDFLVETPIDPRWGGGECRRKVERRPPMFWVENCISLGFLILSGNFFGVPASC